jgi:putative addiction module component (TIGR02574 family)
MDPSTTLQAVRGWPLEDQLEFVFRLWDQLVDDGWQPEPTEELVAELDRRLAAHEADPGNVRTWEQVLKRVRVPR